MPGAVVGIGAAVAGGLAASAFSNVVIGGIVGAIVSTGVGYLGSSLLGAFDTPFDDLLGNRASAVQVNPQGNAQTIFLPYGVVRYGGTRIYTATSGSENVSLAMAFAFADGGHPDAPDVDMIEAMWDLWFDNQPATDPTFAEQVLHPGTPLRRPFTERYWLGSDNQQSRPEDGGRVYFNDYDPDGGNGRTRELYTTGPPIWGSNINPLTLEDRGRGLCHVRLNLTMPTGTEVIPWAGLPTITYEVHGRKVWDPRDPAQDAAHPETWTWSDNPWLCILDYMRSVRYGKGLALDRFDVGSFIAEANYCDEIVEVSETDDLTRRIESMPKIYVLWYTSIAGVFARDIIEHYPMALLHQFMGGPSVGNAGEADSLADLQVRNPTQMRLAYMRVANYDEDFGIGNDIMNAIVGDPWLYDGLGNQQFASGMPFPVNQLYDYRKANWRAAFLDACTAILNQWPWDGLFLDNCSALWGGHLAVDQPGLSAALASVVDELRSRHPEAVIVTNSIERWQSANGKMCENRYADWFTELVPPFGPYPRLDMVQQATYFDFADFLLNGSDEMNVAHSLGAFYGASFSNGSAIPWHGQAEVLFQPYLDTFEPPDFETPISEKRYTLNGIVDTTKPLNKNLTDMLTSCRGSIIRVNGKHFAISDRPKSPEPQHFDERHVIGGWQIQLGGLTNRFNKVIGHFINPKLKWQPDEVIVEDATLLAFDDGQIGSGEIDLPFTTSKAMARRIGGIELKQSRDQMRVAFKGTQDWIDTLPGQVIQFSHETPGWTDKLFIVVRLSLNEDHTVDVELREYDAENYVPEDYVDDETAGDTDLPNPLVVPRPDPLTTVMTSGWVQGANGQSHRGEIFVMWPQIINQFVESLEIQWRLVTTPMPEYSSAVVPPLAINYTISGVYEESDYQIRLRTKSILGGNSAWRDAPTMYTGNAPFGPIPPIVDWSSTRSAPGVGFIFWVPPHDQRVTLVEIYAGGSDFYQPDTFLLATVPITPSVFAVSLPGTARYYWLRARTATGLVSTSLTPSSYGPGIYI